MKPSLKWNVIATVVVGLLLIFLPACRAKRTESPGESTAARATTIQQKAAGATNVKTDIGFRTRRHLAEHYEKHGREFGSITQGEYLYQAQLLRDAPVGGDILEGIRLDGIITRFDRQSSAFVAFNEDYTIRTFFKPNDGERYFKRQLQRGQ
ncbi:MAG: hypothetical protein JST84_06665 [Acidobacteria bacterium]|nr:hypothetical protein [Acidobacteriota bacterium]